ncbi:MAG: hypothetical protein M1817_000551 [Caeruleum heppii]|nr:MAG: hypothetical protein M1817_000551 [Caeruleum heppii]
MVETSQGITDQSPPHTLGESDSTRTVRAQRITKSTKDEKRLLGDYRVPEDAVAIIVPSNSSLTEGMPVYKPSRAHIRPTNTLISQSPDPSSLSHYFKASPPQRSPKRKSLSTTPRRDVSIQQLDKEIQPRVKRKKLSPHEIVSMGDLTRDLISDDDEVQVVSTNAPGQERAAYLSPLQLSSRARREEGVRSESDQDRDSVWTSDVNVELGAPPRRSKDLVRGSDQTRNGLNALSAGLARPEEAGRRVKKSYPETARPLRSPASPNGRGSLLTSPRSWKGKAPGTGHVHSGLLQASAQHLTRDRSLRRQRSRSPLREDETRVPSPNKPLDRRARSRSPYTAIHSHLTEKGDADSEESLDELQDDKVDDHLTQAGYRQSTHREAVSHREDGRSPIKKRFGTSSASQATVGEIAATPFHRSSPSKKGSAPSNTPLGSVKRFRSGHVDCRNSGRLVLHHDPTGLKILRIFEGDISQNMPPTLNVKLSKLQRIVHDDDRTLIQLHCAREGSLDHIFDLEMSSSASGNQVVNTLLAPETDVKLVSRSSTEMRNIFDKRASTRRSWKPAEPAQGISSEDARAMKQVDAPREKQNPRPAKLRVVFLCSRRKEREAGPQCRRDFAAWDRPRTRSKSQRFSLAAPPESRSNMGPVEVGKVWDEPLVYPPTGQRRATVEYSDLERLDEGEFLNDNLISFYLRFLEYQAEQLHPEMAKTVYIFNTFFYERLTNTAGGKRGINYDADQRKANLRNLLVKRTADLPGSAHWYVAIICNLPTFAQVEDPSRASSSSVQSEPASDVPSDTVIVGQSPNTTSSCATGNNERALQRQIEAEVSQLSLGLDGKETGSSDRTGSEGPERQSAKMPRLPESDDDWPSAEEGPAPLKSVFSDSAAGPEDCEPEEGARSPAISIQTPTQSRSYGRKGKRKSLPTPRRYDPSEPVIITLDSLGLPHSVTTRNLKAYLKEEGDHKKGLEVDVGAISGMTAKQIPQQDNFCDCGLFLLGYMEKLLQNPGELVRKLLLRDLDPVSDWPDMNPSRMRSDLRELLIQLVKERERLKKEAKKEEALRAGKYRGAKDVKDAKGKGDASKVNAHSQRLSTKPSLVFLGETKRGVEKDAGHQDRHPVSENLPSLDGGKQSHRDSEESESESKPDPPKTGNPVPGTSAKALRTAVEGPSAPSRISHRASDAHMPSPERRGPDHIDDFDDDVFEGFGADDVKSRLDHSPGRASPRKSPNRTRFRVNEARVVERLESPTLIESQSQSSATLPHAHPSPTLYPASPARADPDRRSSSGADIRALE